MKRALSILFLLVCACLAVVLVSNLSFTPELQASKEIYQEAREKYGKEIKGCKHCHVKPLPKEGDNEFNERGKWLSEEKKRRKADAVDVSWLDAYPGN
jgi:hypothetical protein